VARRVSYFLAAQQPSLTWEAMNFPVFGEPFFFYHSVPTRAIQVRPNKFPVKNLREDYEVPMP
jgi:hypothetical protein